MAIIKCKMCGGDLNINEEITVAECEYCGTKQTVPKVDDEKKITLFQRANRLRFGCEFDKAAGVYESMVADFPEEAEAYWGLVLCKYGIEYVDDPATAKKIPTCHRSSFDSVMDDANFELVMEYSDSVARSVYREEAKAIEELRKGIIEVSGKEEPYDIFICYKETDENGERTIDSVLAQDVYDALCEKGYRVFFSRITLEDKLGQEYEPYIFAALNSAKVMLAFGTSYDYYNAVWVKNEWSRFLQLMTQDKSKHLIPCYKDIDAYDMPKEFAKLQAQDMGKVGAVQDLLRGIEKLIGVKIEEPKETIVREVVSTGGANVHSLIKRGYMALEDKKWDEAKDFFNRALDINAECADAYLGLLLADLKIPNRNSLSNYDVSLDSNSNYVRTCQFADEKLKIFLIECKKKIENRKKENTYFQALQKIGKGTKKDCEDAQKLFKEIINYQDSATLYEVCTKKIEEKINEENNIAMQRANNRKNIRNLQSSLGVELKKLRQEASQQHAEIIKEPQTLKNAKQAQINDIDAKISELRAVRLKLGLFAGKQKKEIDVKILALQNEMNVIIDEVKNIKDEIKEIKNKKIELSSIAMQKLSSLWDEIADRKTISINSYGGNTETIGIKADGNVIVGDSNTKIKQNDVAKWSDVVAISSSGYHMVGLKSNGTVVAVGSNDHSECSVKGWRNIVAISTSDHNTVGLKVDGTVVIAGDQDYYKQCDVDKWNNIVAISTGADNYSNSFLVGLKSDGTVVAVGANGWGQCNVSDWKDIIAISAGGNHTVGLKSDGTVVAVGCDKSSKCKISEWKDIVAICADCFCTIGLKADGTVLSTSFVHHNHGVDGENSETEINNWNDIVAVISGNSNLIGLKSNGSIMMKLSSNLKHYDVSKFTDIKLPNKGV